MKFFVTLILFFIFTFPSLAQVSGSSGSFDARATGMGNTYTAASRGVFSLGNNPANLIFKENRGEIQTFPSISIGGGTDFFSVADYNYFFGGVDDSSNPGTKKGRFLTTADKDKFNSLFDNGGKVSTHFTLPIFRVYYNIGPAAGSIALAVNETGAANLVFPKGLSNFVFAGNTIGSTETISGAQMKMWWLRDYSVSYARDINKDLMVKLFHVPENFFQNFSLGVTLKYITGFAYAGSESFNWTTDSRADRLNLSFQTKGYSAFSPDLGVKYAFDSLSINQTAKFGAMPATAGTGFGVDFGVTAKMNNAFSIAIALTDIGSINWNKNCAVFDYSDVINISNLGDKNQMDSLKNNEVTDKGGFIGGFSTQLPLALRFGLTWQLDQSSFITSFPGTLLLAFDFNQGFNDMPGNSKDPRFSFGLEWKPCNWVPFIRSGVSIGGNDKFNWACGLGFNAGVFDFALATRDLNGLVTKDLRRLSAAVDMRWKF